MAPAKKYSVAPATADHIRRTVGVTREDSRIVSKILAELGYSAVAVDRSESAAKKLVTTKPVPKKAAMAPKGTAAASKAALKKPASKAKTRG